MQENRLRKKQGAELAHLTGASHGDLSLLRKDGEK
jgi:hypothetical protein